MINYLTIPFSKIDRIQRGIERHLSYLQHIADCAAYGDPVRLGRYDSLTLSQLRATTVTLNKLIAILDNSKSEYSRRGFVIRVNADRIAKLIDDYDMQVANIYVLGYSASRLFERAKSVVLFS